MCVCCRQKHHLRDLKSNTKQYCATSNGCPLQQWTEGQPLPVQSIHERYNANQCNQLHVLLEAAGNATSSRPCLNFHLFGHGIQSQSLDRGRVSRIFCELVLILLRVRFLTKAVQKTLTSLAFPAVAKTVLRML